MSTLQNTTRHRHRIRPEALALGALIAIGFALLILMPGGHHTTRPHTASIARPALSAVLATQASGLGDCFVNPNNQARACYQAPVATPTRSGYFRDPSTHMLLRLRAAPQPAGQHPANQSRGRIIP